MLPRTAPFTSSAHNQSDLTTPKLLHDDHLRRSLRISSDVHRHGRHDHLPVAPPPRDGQQLEAYVEEDELNALLAEDLVEDSELPDLADDLDDHDTGLREDWGLSNENYVTFLHSFKSAGKYTKETIKFLKFHESQAACTEADLIRNIVEYFKASYHKKTEDQTVTSDALLTLKLKASTTLRGVFSVLCKFWAYTARGDLKKLAPLVTDLLGMWDKEHRTKQSAVFTKKNIGKLVALLIYIQFYT
jgi:hypothetical protein